MSERITCDIAIVREITTRGVIVEVQRSGGCKSCSVSNLCFGKDKKVTWEIETDQGLSVGDAVELIIAPQARVIASLLVFLMPILALFIGYFTASWWIGQRYGVWGSFVAMIASFLAVWMIDKKYGKRFKASIGRKV